MPPSSHPIYFSGHTFTTLREEEAGGEEEEGEEVGVIERKCCSSVGIETG